MNRLHPVGKLLVCVFYILVVTSFDKYALDKLILMAVFPIFGFVVGELSIKEGLYRMRLILPLVLFVGIFNPFFDRNVLFSIGEGTAHEIAVTGGVISMLTLMLKGFYAVLSAYILIATTSIEEICYGLRAIHVPKIIVIVIMLIYRYFGLMGNEANRIMTAYMLRAPKQKGIHYRAWGSLVGQWLLRSMDRASAVYESMTLRGFNGDFRVKRKGVNPIDVLYPAAWILMFVFIRYIY
ncbi:cobalt ECF transporter T component CbiQ [Butyrivibrio sp. CB08]|uniref:cobalt ECF transporter T component CbiQ n=1 Tax=Butyrivibrio sp. CB08 TaxID=2364879 RepID=UPI001FA9D52E|nr:cobalt ECF transporter T component CbiQ [Butyrivibrio sp. CB08]